jgi:hypothetical protein
MQSDYRDDVGLARPSERRAGDGRSFFGTNVVDSDGKAVGTVKHLVLHPNPARSRA